MQDVAGSYLNYVEGFDQVYAYATAGGHDRAELYGSAGNDRYRSYRDRACLSGANFHLGAIMFEETQSHALQGFDVASLYDSAGNDQFVAAPTYAVMQGPNGQFRHRVDGFDSVTGTAAYGGHDVAELHDSAGDDRVVAAPSYTLLRSAAGIFSNTAAGFESVVARATSGGVDYATLFDSAGNDSLRAHYDFAIMQDLVGTYRNEVRGFAGVFAYASGGNDTAELNATVMDDVLFGQGNVARLWGSNYRNVATGFDAVTALRTAEGQDSIEVGAVDYLFAQVGWA
jgi:hypothetical protein